MNTHSLWELARQHRSETLRSAAVRRRARLARRSAPWRRRVGYALTAAGERFLTLGAALSQRAD